jgi:ribokinase
MDSNTLSSSRTRQPIVVLGSSNTDMIIRVPRIPKAGETILGGKFASAAGGKGANQAVSAARAGGEVTFIARVGRDMFGAKAVSGFIAEGINVDHIIRDQSTPSGMALIFVGQAGQNSIAVASGANGKLAPADVKKSAVAFRRAGLLLVQLETPLKTVQAAVELAAANGLRVVLNPAPAQDLPARLLAKVDLLTPNESEAELLTGIEVKDEASAAQAADQLLARGVRSVIITLGARGAYVAAPGVRQLIPGYKMKAVDTTAAGDVFNGTLTVALAEGKSLLEAARFANAAAAISVGRPGAQDSAPTRREIDQLIGKRKTLRVSPRQNHLDGNGVSHSAVLNGKT